jgi:HEAT repeat protein
MMFQRCTLPAILLGVTLCGHLRAQNNDAPIPYGPIDVPQPVTTVTVKPRTVQLIDEAIRVENDLPRKAMLVRDLGLCPVPESAAILKRLLADPEPLVRAGAVNSLVMIDAADDASLAPLANDPSAVVRRELVLAKYAPAIVAGVTDADPALRVAALSVSVNETTDRAILEQLEQLDPPLQAIALRTLGARKHTAATATIGKLLASESVVARVAAIDALAGMSAITRGQIDQQLTHTHSAVRVAATRAAATLESADRIAIARASLADKDLAVRAEAAKLDVYTDASFVDIYVAQLPLGYQPLRRAAREALVGIARANPQAKPQVTAAAAQRLTDADPQRRIDGSYVLGQLASKEGVADHIKLLRDADWQVVGQASRSLGPIGDPSAADELVQTALRSAEDKLPGTPESYYARSDAGEQAVLSAVMLKHKPVVEATKKYFLSKTAAPGVRNAGIYAAGILGTPEEVGSMLRPLLGRLNDPEESPQAIIEAIKAMGNARVKSMVGQLEKLVKTDTAADFQYAAHLSLDRINGTKTPFTQPPQTREPDTSIRATDPAT